MVAWPVPTAIVTSVRCVSASAAMVAAWSRQIVIRSIPFDRDLGYPRMAVNPRGELVLSYYLATRRRPHSHIEAALFDPPQSR